MHSTFIRGTDVITSWTAPNGGYVLVPNLEAVQDLVRPRCSRSRRAGPLSGAIARVVSNGSWSREFGQVAAYRLGLEGLEVTSMEDIAPEPRTRLVDFTTTPKGSPVNRLICPLSTAAGGDVTRSRPRGVL